MLKVSSAAPLNLLDKSVAAFLPKSKPVVLKDVAAIDRTVERGTVRVLLLHDEMQKSVNALSGHLQVQLAHLELSVKAWRTALGDDVAEILDGRIESNVQRLARITSWLESRPDAHAQVEGSAPPPYPRTVLAATLLAERQKLAEDAEYRQSVLGP